MSATHLYEVNIEWKKDRIGELSSPILTKTIECATPSEFPNGVPNIWSPEHLFVAAINSCFMATFLAIAHNFKLEVDSFKCKTVATLEMAEGSYQITKAELSPIVKLIKKEDAEKVMRVLEKSKAGCLVTNSMKTAITLNPTLH